MKNIYYVAELRLESELCDFRVQGVKDSKGCGQENLSECHAFKNQTHQQPTSGIIPLVRHLEVCVSGCLQVSLHA